MTTSPSLYPPGPTQTPANFTAVHSAYRTQVILVLISLILSLLFYLALVVGSGWLFWKLITWPWPYRADGWYALFRIAGIVSSALLFLYLLKGLFKSSRNDFSMMVEITEQDQPALFDFIRRVCADTGAPLPRKVFLTPEVNAAVFYHSSFFSLILPTSKNLLVGLGLVRSLNLSEVKAVLAHEFGHFSQKSMKLGSYVYVASKVFADIIYGRDWLDDAVHWAKNIDLRISIFVWVFLGVLWVLRKILEGVFKVINIFHLSLMREMEFHADRVAVSVAGSDAIVHGLVRTAFADQAFRQLSADLWAAADHGLYTKDMFHHFLPAAEQLRRRLKKPDLGQPPAERGPQVRACQPDDPNLAIPAMWATHPSNFDRETSAKNPYVPCENDDRPAWQLLTQPSDICFAVTERYYEVVHKPEGQIEYAEPDKVQAFLNDEYAETTYPERYAGFYDNRYLEIADMEALLRKA
ncbi:MAG: M48 family metallopeptidase, partial [Planctomycetes bacterium]|nr:M48 family metallopeptidase [Planctomycetota bacterium]